MNTWNVAYAKSNFAEVIRQSENEPQFISRRNKPVAVIMNLKQYDKEQVSQVARSSVKELFAELRMIQQKEQAIIEIPERKDREDTFQS